MKDRTDLPMGADIRHETVDCGGVNLHCAVARAMRAGR